MVWTNPPGVLVQRAERAIAKANPQEQGKRTHLELRDSESRSEPVSQEVLKKMRQAHAELDDDTFEELASQDPQPEGHRHGEVTEAERR